MQATSVSSTGDRSWCCSLEARLWYPLHAGDVAPDAIQSCRLQRAASDRAETALRRGLALLLRLDGWREQPVACLHAGK